MQDLWHKFKLAEWTEIMHQKGNTIFIELLNKIRVGTVDVSFDYILKSQFIQQSEGQYPYHALRNFAEKEPASRYNKCMLIALNDRLISIPSKDHIPKNWNVSDVSQQGKQSETGGLSVLLKVKVNARVMIVANIDLSDRLVDGQRGTLKYISINQNEVNAIYVAFDDVF